MHLFAINFSVQNFCIKHFPLPLPSQKISLPGNFMDSSLEMQFFGQMPV